MLIAQRTKKSNIAEHIIYMFQVEDLIRAHKLDLVSIIEVIIKPQIQDEELLAAYTNWYADLIKIMKQHKLEEKGHIPDVNEVLMELLLLHNTLINISKEKKYLSAFEQAFPVLKDFQQKSNSGDLNLVEVGFNALYGKMILKLKGQEISDASEEGFSLISKMLALLAHFYTKMKSGDLSFTNN